VVDWVAFEEEDIRRDVALFSGKTRRYVYISSCGAYRKPVLSPWVVETAPIGNPFWKYADLKARCELLLWDQYRASGFPACVIRPGYTYAEFTLPSGFLGMGFGIADRIVRGRPILVHGDGTGLFNFTSSEDFARALVPLLSLPSIVGETFNVASGEVHSWIRLYTLIAEALQYPVQFVTATTSLIQRFDAEVGTALLGDKAHSYIVDSSKLKRFVPSFSPKVSLREGIQTSIQWWLSHRGEIRVDPKKDEVMERLIRCVQDMEASTER
jgi:nucleoside-diphosphate-sugar epimerase